MDYTLIAVVVLTALISVREAFRRGGDDANWELRRRGLDPGYRDWLAAMTTSRPWMGTLSDPAEVELAQGFARRERRRLGYLDLASVALAFLGLALVLLGVVPSSAVVFLLVVLTAIHTLFELLRKASIRRRLPRRKDPEEVPVRRERAEVA